MSNTALYHLPKICPSSMFIIQLFIFIAVYWVYGSHNVMNDLYLSERRIGVSKYYIKAVFEKTACEGSFLSAVKALEGTYS